MIPVPSGARVWRRPAIPTCVRDLMDWRSWFRRRCGVIRMAGTCSSFGAAAPLVWGRPAGENDL